MTTTPARDPGNPHLSGRVTSLRSAPAPPEKMEVPLRFAAVPRPLNRRLRFQSSRRDRPAGDIWRHLMNKVFLSGRITSDIARFGTESKGGVSFTLVTSRPVIKDGQVVKGEDGYNETYDQFHTVKAFNGLGKSIANNKKKGDKLIVTGEIRYTKNEKDGRTFYNTDIVADEIEFI
jgi:single-strand DNA-binding protein